VTNISPFSVPPGAVGPAWKPLTSLRCPSSMRDTVKRRQHRVFRIVGVCHLRQMSHAPVAQSDEPCADAGTSHHLRAGELPPEVRRTAFFCSGGGGNVHAFRFADKSASIPLTTGSSAKDWRPNGIPCRRRGKLGKNIITCPRRVAPSILPRNTNGLYSRLRNRMWKRRSTVFTRPSAVNDRNVDSSE